MSDQEIMINSPLTEKDIELIDSTGLPNLERHQLRLLAHCLACFKLMNNGSTLGAFPKEQDRLMWCLSQPYLIKDKSFIPIFLEQLSAVASYLEAVANNLNITPLELTLNELIKERLKKFSTQKL